MHERDSESTTGSSRIVFSKMFKQASGLSPVHQYIFFNDCAFFKTWVEWLYSFIFVILTYIISYPTSFLFREFTNTLCICLCNTYKTYYFALTTKLQSVKQLINKNPESERRTNLIKISVAEIFTLKINETTLKKTIFKVFWISSFSQKFE